VTTPSLDAAAARRVRLVVLDVDGVMTDGGIYLGAAGHGSAIEVKRFDVADGLGIHLLREVGLTVAIVTGRESEAVRLRAAELGIEEVHQDSGANKLPILQGVLDRLGIGWEETAFLADDLADLPVLTRVGLPASVANGVAEVRAVAHWVGRRRGGHGAVREFAEALLGARGEWAESVQRYVAARERGERG
jgi:3-deoxy-D-manno-octulosonate 8-phosphate phosphatase (KDO 8-P phosphatase)